MKKFKFLLILVVSCLLLVVSSTSAIAEVVATDPMRLGVGARALGMGRAGVAVGEDGETVFLNPAGLGGISSPKITSMYTNFMSDVNYVVLGGAYPFGKSSAVGAGLLTTNVSGIALYDGAGTSLGSGSWGNSVMFASYGTKLNDKLKLGGNVKYYSQGGTGTASIDAAAGSGIGLDVGAIYSVSDALSVAAVLRNGMGNIESGNNISNKLPMVIKAGVAYKVPMAGGRRLTLAADYDIGNASALHAGAEWFVTPVLALRAGLDQDPSPDGAVTNVTAGLGLRVKGIAFDFAYHPYGDLAEDTTYYFSIGYVGDTSLEPTKLDLEMALNSPSDKSIIYTESVQVSGKLTGADATKVTVYANKVAANLAADGTFTASVPLDKLGKKLIQVEAVDKKGRKLTAERRVLRLVSFKDVNTGFWAKNPIEHTGTVGLVKGYPDGNFKPDRSLTRAELAALLVRARNYKVPGRPVKVFKDVPANHWGAGYIEIAKRTGLVKGYPDGRFRPNNRINNAEAVTVMARFDGMSKKFGKTAFTDVSKKHWSAGYVNAAENAGMLTYVSDNKFEPNKAVTRAKSVKMLSKTSLATRLVDDLLSWDKGFQFEITRPTIKASAWSLN